MCAHVSVHSYFACTSVFMYVYMCSLMSDGWMWGPRNESSVMAVNDLIGEVTYDLGQSSMGHHWKCFFFFNGKRGVFTGGTFSLNLCQAHTQSTWFDLLEMDQKDSFCCCLQTNGFL